METRKKKARLYMPKYVSPADIAEMKARGYEAATIETAEADLQLWQEAQAVYEVIRSAFAGVTLGGGVGLKQARGLDDYADEVTLATLRATDEKEDWQRISAEELRRYNDTLSFFDAEGMRFHLPAFLIASLQDVHDFGLGFQLTYDGGSSRDRFRLLDARQQNAVRAFLLLIAKDADYRYDLDIKRALQDRWVEMPTA